jgi:O-antigen/teichoic acid export membrane protein
MTEEIAPVEVTRRETARLGFVVLVDQCVVSAANFLVSFLLGRLVLPAEFGAYSLAFATLNALNGIQGALVITPLTVFGASLEGARLKEYLGGTFGMQAVVSLGSSILAFAVAGVLWSGRPAIAPAFVALALLIGLDQGQEFMRRLLLARLRIMAALVNDLVYALVRLACLGALIAAQHNGSPVLTARNSILCAVAAALVANLIGIAQIRSLLESPLAGLRASLHRNWEFGRWGLAGAGTLAISSQVSPWLLLALQGAATVGTLGACQTIVFASNPLQSALSVLWGPLAARDFSRGGVPALRISTRRYAIVTVLAMGAFASVIICAGRPLLHLIYSGRYDGSATVLSLLALSAVLGSLSRPQVNALNAMRRPDLTFAAQMVMTALSLGLAWPAIRYYGLPGLATMSVITSASSLLIRGSLVLRAEGSPGPGQ